MTYTNEASSSEGHAHAMETHNNKSIQDLTNQVNELSLKIGQLAAPPPPGIEFPKFSGDDFNGWIYKCDQFFQLYNNIPNDTKLKMASIHMEGEPLHWHKTFTETKTTPPQWDEYVKEIETRFANRASQSNTQTIESTPTPQTETKKPRRRICSRLQEINGGEKLRFTFGPIYRTSEENDSLSKKSTWEHVVKSTPGRAAVTTEIYLSRVRLIEKEARNCYGDGETGLLSGSQFRWMMILDGCFFLQLVLYLLGGCQQLGYPMDDPIFGKRNVNSRFKDVKDWIEAMFFIGNQVPMVVLKELMKGSYFQKVIKEGKWEKPSDLSRRALYELLLLPEIESHRLWRNPFLSRNQWLQHQEPTDLIHGLHLLVLGPEPNSTDKEEQEDDDDEDDDIEAQHEENAIDDKVSSSATDLKQAGVHFWLSRGIGSRGISFTNSIFFCHGYAILHMPPISINGDTEMMLSCLRDYEVSQKMGMSKREICSYIRFMSELVRTPDDAKLLASKNIIQGNMKHKHKLPGILRRLASRDTYNQNLRLVKLKISDYSPPIWKKYWHIISLGLIITVLQTVYTILPYYKS